MIKKFSDRIYYMEGDGFSDRPFIYYIKGEQKSLAVEAGASPNHVKAFYKGISEAGLRKPDYTVITHSHWDHTFGMNGVEGIMISSRLTDEKLIELSRLDWSKEALEERVAEGKEIRFCAECMKREFPYLSDIHIVRADIVLDNEMTVDLGNLTCRVIPHDSTHSRDSVFVYVPEEKVLATGDAQYEDYYDNNFKYDADRLEMIVNYLESFDCDYILAGHQPIVSKVEMMEYMRSRNTEDQPPLAAL